MELVFLLFCACTALGAGFAAYYARRCALYAGASSPIALRAHVNSLKERIDTAEAIVSGSESNMTLWRAEMTALAESVDTNLDRVERKRRSASAAASRMETLTQGDPDSLENLTARARAAGIL